MFVFWPFPIWHRELITRKNTRSGAIPRRADEQVTENGDHRRLRNCKSEDDTNDQSADDTLDQIDAVPFLNQVFITTFLFPIV